MSSILSIYSLVNLFSNSPSLIRHHRWGPALDAGKWGIRPPRYSETEAPVPQALSIDDEIVLDKHRRKSPGRDTRGYHHYPRSARRINWVSMPVMTTVASTLFTY